MLDILRCDSCSKPLGAGAIKRGDAKERQNLVICRSCLALEANGHSLPISAPEESKAKWKVAKAATHADAIERERKKAASKRRPKAPEHDTEVVELPPIMVVDSQGKEVEVSYERASDGRLLLRLPESKSSARLPARKSKSLLATETAPTAQVSSKGEIRLPKPTMTRAALGNRLDADSLEKQEGRSRNLFSAMLLMAIVLPALGFSLYTAIDSQRELNKILARQEAEKNKQTKPRTQPTPKTNKLISEAPETIVDGRPVKVPALYPLSINQELATALRAQEREIKSSIVVLLQADELETRLDGITQAIHHMAIDCAPHIRPLMKSGHHSESQLACEAMGFLMVSEARPELEAIQADETKPNSVRHAAGRALSRMDFVSRNNTLDGWSDKELEDLANSLSKQGSNAKALEIVKRAIAARQKEK